MSKPIDGAGEALNPVVEERSQDAPGDHESAALQPCVRHEAAPDPETRDHGALAEAADVRGQAGPEQAVDAEQGDDIDRRPRIPIQKAVVLERAAAEAAAAQDITDEEGAVETVRASEEDTRRVGELAMNGVGRNETDAGEADDAELDLEFDEDKDFDSKGGDDVRVSTDNVEMYKRDLEVAILDREQVIERSKEVEAGLTADWVLRVNDAVDSPDDDALLNLRDEYIETRQENMRLGKKDEGEDEGDGESAEAEAPDPAAEAGISKYKQVELAAERARAEKLRLATDEADELIALGLRFRDSVQPDKTELSDETRRDLGAIADRGVSAKRELVGSIQKWAFKISMKYTGKGARKGIGQDDLIQEGNLGAIRAVEKFDHTKGYTLSTYSKAWVEQFVTRAINTGDTVRRPQHVAEQLAKVHNAEERLRARLQPGEELTEDAIAREAKVKPAKLADLRQVDHVTVSLDRPLGGDDDEGGTTLGDIYRDKEEEQLDAGVAERDRMELLREAVRDALAGINDDRIERIVRGRMGLLEGSDGQPMTLDEIAKSEGVTRERIRQLAKKGMDRIEGNEAVMARLSALRR